MDTRVMVLAATSIGELAATISVEVRATLDRTSTHLLVGTSSRASGDIGARAARWVARAGSQLGIPSAIRGPGDGTHVPDVRWPTDPEGSDAPSASRVGVSRLDLTPEVSAVEQPYAVALWSLLAVPPGWRDRVARWQGPADTDLRLLAAAGAPPPLATVMVGQDRRFAVAMVATDLLAAEVVARALRVAIQPVGDLGLSPWEAGVVQRGIETRAGVTNPEQISLTARWVGDPQMPGHDRLHRVMTPVLSRAGIAAAPP